MPHQKLCGILLGIAALAGCADSSDGWEPRPDAWRVGLATVYQQSDSVPQGLEKGAGCGPPCKIDFTIYDASPNEASFSSAPFASGNATTEGNGRAPECTPSQGELRVTVKKDETLASAECDYQAYPDASGRFHFWLSKESNLQIVVSAISGDAGAEIAERNGCIRVHFLSDWDVHPERAVDRDIEVTLPFTMGCFRGQA